MEDNNDRSSWNAWSLLYLSWILYKNSPDFYNKFMIFINFSVWSLLKVLYYVVRLLMILSRPWNPAPSVWLLPMKEQTPLKLHTSVCEFSAPFLLPLYSVLRLVHFKHFSKGSQDESNLAQPMKKWNDWYHIYCLVKGWCMQQYTKNKNWDPGSKMRSKLSDLPSYSYI